MDLVQTLGNLGEFVGGVLIIGTLIYLAVQTKQSAKVSYFQMYTDASDETGTFFMELAKDPELTDLWWLIQRANFDDLSVEQRRRGSLLFESFLIHAEGAYFMNTEFSNAPRSTHERWVEVIGKFMTYPVASEMWERQKYSKTLEFQQFVDSTKAK